MVGCRIARILSFVGAILFLGIGIRCESQTAGEVFRLLTPAQETAIDLQSSCTRIYTENCPKIYGEGGGPECKCSGSGVNVGGLLYLHTAYLVPAISESGPFAFLTLYDDLGHFRNTVPALFSTPADVRIGRRTIPAGVYALYVNPVAGGGWQLILNRKILTPGEKYDPMQESGRYALIKARTFATPPENFILRFPPANQAGGGIAQEMHLIWGDSDFYLVIAAIPSRDRSQDAPEQRSKAPVPPVRFAARINPCPDTKLF